MPGRPRGPREGYLPPAPLPGVYDPQLSHPNAMVPSYPPPQYVTPEPYNAPLDASPQRRVYGPRINTDTYEMNSDEELHTPLNTQPIYGIGYDDSYQR